MVVTDNPKSQIIMAVVKSNPVLAKLFGDWAFITIGGDAVVVDDTLPAHM